MNCFFTVLTTAFVTTFITTTPYVTTTTSSCTCDDGMLPCDDCEHCYNQTNHCDGMPQCNDATDETDCKCVKNGISYDVCEQIILFLLDCFDTL